MDPLDAKRQAREEELDRFWNIDALLPARKQTPRSTNTDTAEITIEPSRTAQTPGERIEKIEKRDTQSPPIVEQTVVHSVAGVETGPIHRYVSTPPPPKQPDEEYTPDSALLRRVRIYRWRSSYQYYEEFVQIAEKLLRLKGKPCAHVPFFSYVPQYSQLDRAQLAWYLHFRDCVRESSYPDTDYSYVILYIYEIINLAEKMDCVEGQSLLCRLWANYRRSYRQLDAYLPEWICDYSLIHRLPPPKELDAHLLRRIMQGCRLREFYVTGGEGSVELRALLAFCSNYDYRKSKFYTEDSSELFDRTVLSVLEAVTRRLSGEGKLFSASGMEDCTVTRDAYSGALCSYRVKRRIEVSYCSFSRSHELRFLITDVIKYTENKLRAHLGVRSKLSIYALPVPLREQIDALTAHLKPTSKRAESRKKAEEEAIYEKLYELPKKPLSLSHAAQIEQESWKTTERLVDAFDEPPTVPSPPPMRTVGKQSFELPAPSPAFASERAATEAENGETRLLGMLTPYAAFLEAVLAEDGAAQRAAAQLRGGFPDAVADEINELAADQIGDVVLEENDGRYTVIEDYRELLERIKG